MIVLSVCLSFCEQDYWKNNEPISLKLGIMTKPTYQKNWLSFGGAPVPDTDSGSILHFSHNCKIGDFRRFISNSHTVAAKFFTKLGEMTDKVMNQQHFGGHLDPDPDWSSNPDQNPGSLLVEILCRQRFALSEQCCLIMCLTSTCQLTVTVYHLQQI